MHVVRHTMHVVREQNGIEHHSIWRHIPLRRILHNPGEFLRPRVLDTQGHRIGQVFFESIRRHAFEPVGIDAVHEFLESEDLDLSSDAFQALGGHDPCKQDDDHDRYRE